MVAAALLACWRHRCWQHNSRVGSNVAVAAAEQQWRWRLRRRDSGGSVAVAGIMAVGQWQQAARQWQWQKCGVCIWRWQRNSAAAATTTTTIELQRGIEAQQDIRWLGGSNGGGPIHSGGEPGGSGTHLRRKSRILASCDSGGTGGK